MAEKGESAKSTVKKKEKGPPINTQTLCDEDWKCDVVFIYEGDKDGANFITLLQQIPPTQIADPVKVINKSTVIKDLKKSAGKGSKKSTASSQKDKQESIELTDEQIIAKCLKENTTIPGKPLATIIKNYLIELKIEDINARRNRLALSSKPPKKMTKPESKGNKKKDEVIDSDVTKETAEKAIEIPPLFIILVGFNEHDLPIELVKQEVNVCAVVKIKGATKLEQTVKKTDVGKGIPTLDSQKFNMTWLNFWRGFKQLMKTPETADFADDLAAPVYLLPSDVTDGKMNVKDKKARAISLLTDMMLYIRNLLSSHKLFCKNVTMVDIATELKPKPPDLYNTLIEKIPLECVTIPSILFSIVEQVCRWNEEEFDIDVGGDEKSVSGPERRKIADDCAPRILWHNDEHSLKTFHLKIPEINFDKIVTRLLSNSHLLKLNSKEMSERLENHFVEFHLQRLWKSIDEYIHLKLFYIYFHWYILCKMKTDGKLDLMKCTINEYGKLIDVTGQPYQFSYLNEPLGKWVNEIEWENQTEQSESSSEMGRDDPCVTKTTMDIVDSDDSLERGNDSGNRKLTNFSNFKIVQLIENKRKADLMVLKNFLCCSEILCLCQSKDSVTKQDWKSLKDYKFIEDMTSSAVLQSLQESLSDFSQVQRVYYYPSNKILLRFYNSTKFIFEEYKTGKVDTMLGFRDYCIGIVETDQNDKIQINNLSDHLPAFPAAENETSDVSEEGEQSKAVYVYNIGKKLIRFDQNTKKFFSQDGSSVTVEVEDWYPLSRSVTICVRKLETEMIIHVNGLLSDSSDYKSLGEIPIETMKLSLKLPNETLLSVTLKEQWANADNANFPVVPQFIYENFTVTVPNGLVVQMMLNRYDKNSVYIKQTYVGNVPDKIRDEKCRCFLKSGTVVVFQNDGPVKVMYASTATADIDVLKEIEVENKEETVVGMVENKSTKNTGGGKKQQLAMSAIEEEEEELPEDDGTQFAYQSVEHSIKSWSGITYHYLNESCVRITDNEVKLRKIFLPPNGLYVDRSDGVKCFFDEDGTLVTVHQDGTILTTNAFEELQPPTVETLDTFSLNPDKLLKSMESQSIDMSLTYKSVFEQEPMAPPESDEIFTTYKMGSTAEHPNYATVKFQSDDDSIDLELADNLRITIQDIQNGTFEFSVDIDNNTVVFFKNHCIDFEASILKTTGSLNATNISPIFLENTSLENLAHFCKTVDSFGRMFSVDRCGAATLRESDAEQKHYTEIVHDIEFRYEDRIPSKTVERLFVVNDDFSGYEFINRFDISLLDESDEKKFKNVDVTKTPTKNRVSSKTNQYYLYETHSDRYLLKQKFELLVPSLFERSDLSPPWTPDQSPWLLVEHEAKKGGFRHFLSLNVAKHTDDRILAVIVKTVQQVSHYSGQDGLDIIFNCLEKYQDENKRILKKYRKQGFSDTDIETRLNQNYQLINAVKKEIPLWNVIRRECSVCKQNFGFTTTLQDDNKASNKELGNTGFEKEIEAIDYSRS